MSRILLVARTGIVPQRPPIVIHQSAPLDAVLEALSCLMVFAVRYSFSCAKSLLLVMVGLAVSRTALAQAPYNNTLLRSNYIARCGDYNGDNRQDILMEAKRKIVLIDYDIPIPVPIPTPSASFVLLSSGSSDYTLSTPVSAAMLTSTVWQMDCADLQYGDLLGNGVGAVFIRPHTGGVPGITVTASSATGTPQLSQVLTPSNLGIDLSSGNVTTTLSDLNGDGRADLTVKVSGIAQMVFLADSEGHFNAPDDDQSMQAVWRGLKTFLQAGDTGHALLHISLTARSAYGKAFAEVGAEELKITSEGWSDITLLSWDGDLATWWTTVIDDGVSRTHLVTFVKEDGLWYVEAF